SRSASTSACAVGSPVRSRSLCRRATISSVPRSTTTAPTGTSPWSSAARASSSATCIARASSMVQDSNDGSGGLDDEHRVVGRDAPQFGVARARADAAEELSDLPLPTAQVGDEDGDLVVVAELAGSELLDAPADPQL